MTMWPWLMKRKIKVTYEAEAEYIARQVEEWVAGQVLWNFVIISHNTSFFLCGSRYWTLDRKSIKEHIKVPHFPVNWISSPYLAHYHRKQFVCLWNDKSQWWYVKINDCRCRSKTIFIYRNFHKLINNIVVFMMRRMHKDGKRNIYNYNNCYLSCNKQVCLVRLY